MNVIQLLQRRLEGKITYLPNKENPNIYDEYVPLNSIGEFIGRDFPQEEFIRKIIQLTKDYMFDNRNLDISVIEYVKKHLND